MACAPCSAMTALKRAWMASSAASQVTGSKRPSPFAAKRRGQASRPVDPVRIGRGDLGAEHAAGVRVDAGPAHLHDALPLHRDGQAARVGTVEGTDTGTLRDHEGLLSPRGAARDHSSYRILAARSQPRAPQAAT